MTTAKLVASSYSVTGTVVVNQNEDSLYEDTGNSSNPARVTHTTNGTSSYYLYLKGFNFSSIPSNAVVSSFAIHVKGYESGLSTSTSYAPRLYNNSSGTTWSTITGASAASSNFSTSTNTITVPYTGTWDTLKGYGSNLGIRLVIRRSRSNTQGYLYIYGAEIEVTYTIPVYHDVTVTNNTSATVTPTGTTSVLEGEDVEVTTNTLSGITVTDNGVNVTSQFVQEQGGSVSAVPGSYTTGGSINGTNYQSTIGKGSDTSNRTGNDYFSTTQGGSGSTYIDYHFDFSDIPPNATIQSVSVTVKGHCEDTSQSREISRVQCYSGTTAKGSYTDITDSTTDKVYTLSPGTWTRSELDNAILKHTIGVYGGLVSGATWTVTYEASGYVYTISNVTTDHTIVFSSSGAQPELYVKRNGSWVKIATAYKKVNGSWVQVSLDQAFSSGTNYVAG